jgi:hypothetical protein
MAGLEGRVRVRRVRFAVFRPGPRCPAARAGARHAASGPSAAERRRLRRHPGGDKAKCTRE